MRRVKFNVRSGELPPSESRQLPPFFTFFGVNCVGHGSHQPPCLLLPLDHTTTTQACKAIAPLYYRLARACPNVKFVDVAVTDKNTDLHQGLEVPSLPYGHVYHPSSGLVEEMKLNRRYFPEFEAKVQSYVSSICDLPDGDCSNPFLAEETLREEQVSFA